MHLIHGYFSFLNLNFFFSPPNLKVYTGKVTSAFDKCIDLNRLESQISKILGWSLPFSTLSWIDQDFF